MRGGNDPKVCAIDRELKCRSAEIAEGNSPASARYGRARAEYTKKCISDDPKVCGIDGEMK